MKNVKYIYPLYDSETPANGSFSHLAQISKKVSTSATPEVTKANFMAYLHVILYLETMAPPRI